jgi:hypothetical protein
MKQLLLSIFLFPLLVSAQTYPCNEGFEGMPSSQPPVGWGGSMKVLLDHGRNDSKGLAARLNSAVTADSSITPLIGPLTSSTSFSFYYRIIDFAFYPDGAATNLDIGDQVEVLVSTDSINYTVVELIDMNNHNPSFNFVKKKVFVPQYAGSNVLFKIRCQFGTGAGYYVDFDTISIGNDAQLGINDLNSNKQISLFPNPCSSGTEIQSPINNSEVQQVKVFNSLGELVFENQLTANYQLLTANWAIGIYLVLVGDETEKLTRRLIVQH